MSLASVPLNSINSSQALVIALAMSVKARSQFWSQMVKPSQSPPSLCGPVPAANPNCSNRPGIHSSFYKRVWKTIVFSQKCSSFLLRKCRQLISLTYFAYFACNLFCLLILKCWVMCWVKLQFLSAPTPICSSKPAGRSRFS